jgi:hypothetical protein
MNQIFLYKPDKGNFKHFAFPSFLLYINFLIFVNYVLKQQQL